MKALNDEELKMLSKIDNKLFNGEPLNKEEELFKSKMAERNKLHLEAYNELKKMASSKRMTTINFRK